ncbi:MAG: hypothetical protein NT109_09390 [Flavobacteriia bacterium]|nr:hypothetical protein [Flavobacteriia bacterium]
MKIVNRGYLSILPSAMFWEWANTNCPADNLLFQNDEPSIYLIEEDFWEEDAVITTYFSKIAKSEFETVNPNKETWPIISNAEEFNAYFRYFSGNMVFDLLSIGINSEEV